VPQTVDVDIHGIGRARLHFERFDQRRKNFPPFWQ
jgi:hypothetical protein